jgi:hypothetical protein
VPIIDHGDRIFSRKWHRVTLFEDLLNFHASGEGHRGHEILYHATVPELVLDGVSMVRTSLLKELLKVVHGWSHLMLAAACDGCGTHNAGGTRLIVDAAIVADRNCGLLMALLVPLLATLGTLPDILEDDTRRRFPAAAWSWVKLGCLVADGILGNDAA